MKLKTPQNEIDNIIELHMQGLSSRKILKQLETVKSKSTVNNVIGLWKEGLIEYSKSETTLNNHLPKVLFIDIETAPNKFMGWGLWNQNFSLDMIESEWFILSYAAKWAGSDELIYNDVRGKVDTEDDLDLLAELWELLDTADIIVGQNSRRFDMKKINARLIMNGFQPPSPYKQVDTLEIAKKHFNFTSNKLEWMTDKLNVVFKKLDHANYPGFKLWKGMMADEQAAWEECEAYNKHDVLSLEELFWKLSPWSNSIPNFNLYHNTSKHVCRCGSDDIVQDGFAYTSKSKFQQYRCRSCGATTRDSVNLFSKEKRASLHMNVAG